MTAAPFPTSLDQLAEMIDQVSSRHEPIVIGHNSKKAVLISLEDFGEMDETAYLKSSPVNKALLEAAIAQSRAGAVVERSIDLGA
ncbi:MAG: prevent-host-death protein [Verrucomicrobiaceae bacterium]|nr:prevent-host-death protein [Verrucomicrobiaceae bacterium]